MVKRINFRKRFKTEDYIVEHNDYSQKQFIGKNISLLNWNIQKKNKDPIWEVEFKNLIEKYNPEIILIQECQFQKGVEKVLHFEKYGFVFAPNFSDTVKNKHSGLLTASITNHQRVSVIKSFAFEPLFKIPKIFLTTSYLIESEHKDLLVLNIHAINFAGYWKFISQIQQLEYAIRNHIGPVLLSGDFNTWNKKRIYILNKILTSCNLKKVQFSKKYAKNIKRFLFNMPLDHIYYRGLKIDSPPEALNTKSSDHNPLLVKFHIS